MTTITESAAPALGTLSPSGLDIPRDRYGRPLILPDPALVEPGVAPGKPVAYTRASTLGKVLEEQSALTQWKQRMTLLGVVKAPHLAMSASQAQNDRAALNKLCEEAMTVAQAGARAAIGTALHSIWEAIDKGADPGPISPEYRADVAARQAATKGFEWCAVEKFVVCDDLLVAGTTDRVRVVRPKGRGKAGKPFARIVDDKGLALDTPLPTPSGWTTMGAVEVGDEVIDAFGKPCTVIRKSEVKRIGTHVVRFDDGSTIVCDTEHLWWTATRSEREPSVKPIADVIATLRSGRGQADHRVPVAGALDLPDADLPIDPYLLGAWLGDGHKRDGCITKSDELFAVLESDGHVLGVRQAQPAGKEHIATRTVVGLNSALRALGLRGHKHIPDVYLRASRSQRLRLLQGLLDTDGSWNIARRRVAFQVVDKALATQVHELVLSLGERSSLSERAGYGFGKHVTVYGVEFTPTVVEPFRLPSKAGRVDLAGKSLTTARRRVIVAVEPGPDVPTQCIAVDSPSHTYLCGDAMIPTHNTGSSVDYGMLGIAVQLACYAHGKSYDPATGARSPIVVTPEGDELEVDLRVAEVIHTPAGEGKSRVLEVDIAAGWTAAQIAKSVKAIRNDARKWAKVASEGEASLADLVTACTTEAALFALYEQRGAEFDAEVGPLASATLAAIRGGLVGGAA